MKELIEEFEKEMNYEIHTEYKGKSSKYSTKKGEWVLIPKVEAYKAFSEWQSNKIQSLQKAITSWKKEEELWKEEIQSLQKEVGELKELLNKVISSSMMPRLIIDEIQKTLNKWKRK